ncbi:uncharacterized protein AMSG_07320 [Thecamonas trahens ATCC 50062]|uniref:Uncharacterized protein n=1 Tax=Thecamonas trahens ATCC 50062 TaxID=461836 RepID=A0A0L0DG53_THETB|nr:hypothetical protein AMSG_07320 [Thecamonas trahens ATCC 50062]KNC51309.1 hypothetical protein AMSG_07320 [Thecamonas trahens ATCC 50062]|eukprot:XP_013756231.1 hypothetical protein AMSG_07320 [Thecamonas trahens ATCC 50062]
MSQRPSPRKGSRGSRVGKRPTRHWHGLSAVAALTLVTTATTTAPELAAELAAADGAVVEVLAAVAAARQAASARAPRRGGPSRDAALEALAADAVAARKAGRLGTPLLRAVARKLGQGDRLADAAKGLETELEAVLRDYHKLKAKHTKALGRAKVLKDGLRRSKAARRDDAATTSALIKSAHSYIDANVRARFPQARFPALATLPPLPANVKIKDVSALLKSLVRALLADIVTLLGASGAGSSSAAAAETKAVAAKVAAQVARLRDDDMAALEAYKTEAQARVAEALERLALRESELVADIEMERDELEYQIESLRRELASAQRCAPSANSSPAPLAAHHTSLAAAEAAFESLLADADARGASSPDAAAAAAVATALLNLPEPPPADMGDYEGDDVRAQWSVSEWDSALALERERRAALQHRYEAVVALLHDRTKDALTAATRLPAQGGSTVSPSKAAALKSRLEAELAFSDKLRATVERLQFELEEARAELAALREQSMAQVAALSPPHRPHAHLDLSDIYSHDHMALEELHAKHTALAERMAQVQAARVAAEARAEAAEVAAAAAAAAAGENDAGLADVYAHDHKALAEAQARADELAERLVKALEGKAAAESRASTGASVAAEELRAERDAARAHAARLEDDLAFYVAHFKDLTADEVELSRVELLTKRVELLQHELASERAKGRGSDPEWEMVLREKRQLEAQVRNLWARNRTLEGESGGQSDVSSTALHDAELERTKLANQLRLLQERFNVRAAADEYELQRLRAQVAASRRRPATATSAGGAAAEPHPDTPAPQSRRRRRRPGAEADPSAVLSELEVTRLESELNAVRRERSAVDSERKRLEAALVAAQSGRQRAA